MTSLTNKRVKKPLMNLTATREDMMRYAQEVVFQYADVNEFKYTESLALKKAADEAEKEESNWETKNSIRNYERHQEMKRCTEKMAKGYHMKANSKNEKPKYDHDSLLREIFSKKDSNDKHSIYIEHKGQKIYNLSAGVVQARYQHNKLLEKFEKIKQYWITTASPSNRSRRDSIHLCHESDGNLYSQAVAEKLLPEELVRLLESKPGDKSPRSDSDGNVSPKDRNHNFRSEASKDLDSHYARKNSNMGKDSLLGCKTPRDAEKGDGLHNMKPPTKGLLDTPEKSMLSELHPDYGKRLSHVPQTSNPKGRRPSIHSDRRLSPNPPSNGQYNRMNSHRNSNASGNNNNNYRSNNASKSTSNNDLSEKFSNLNLSAKTSSTSMNMKENTFIPPKNNWKPFKPKVSEQLNVTVQNLAPVGPAAVTKHFNRNLKDQAGGKNINKPEGKAAKPVWNPNSEPFVPRKPLTEMKCK